MSWLNQMLETPPESKAQQEKIDKLTSQLSKAASHLRVLTKENSDSTEKYNLLLSTLDSLKLENVKLKESIDLVQQENIKLADFSSNTKLLDEINSLQSDSKVLQNELSSLKNENGMLKAQIAGSSNQASPDVVASLESEKLSLETENSSLSQNLESIQNEKLSLESNYNTLLESYHELQASQNSDLQLNFNTLESQYNQLLSKHQETNSNYSLLVKEFQDSSQECTRLTNENQTLSGDYSKLMQSFNQLNSNFNLLESSIQSSNLNDSDLNTQLKESVADLSIKLEESIKDNNQLSSNLDKLNQELIDANNLNENIISQDIKLVESLVIDLDSKIASSIKVFLDSASIQPISVVFRNFVFNIQGISDVCLLISEKMSSVDSSNSIDSYTVEIDRLNKTIQSLDAEKAGLVQQNEAMMEKLSSMISSKSIESYTVEIERLNETIQSLNIEKTGLVQQNEAMMEKLKEIKSTIMPRLQEEIAQNAELNQLNRELTDKLSHLEASDQSENTKSTKEVERLRQHLIEAEDTYTNEIIKAQSLVSEYKSQLDQISLDKENLQVLYDEAKSNVESFEQVSVELNEKISELSSDLVRVRNEGRKNVTSLDNLQLVLAEFQASREQDIKNAIQSISNQLTLQLEAVEMWKEECFKVEEKYEDILKEQSTVEDLKNQLAQQSVLLQKSKVEVSTYKNHLDEAMRRMKNGSDSTIDKRIIANLIVSYISAPRGDKTRHEILSVLAGVLQLTDSEKFKVGVGRRPAAASSPVVDDLGNSSFTELWVNFLLNSANGDPDPAGNISRRNSIESLKSLTSANSWFQNVSEPPVQGNNSSN